MFEFSIAIPAHDRGENGPKWMSELLDSLERQTFQDFEVVVSDQSKNDDIMNVCKDYDFQFTYIKYQGDVPCENINIALNHCEGRIIKPMFSDDIFLKDYALERIQKEYDKLDVNGHSVDSQTGMVKINTIRKHRYGQTKLLKVETY